MQGTMEHYMEGKYDDQTLCEDGLFIGDHCVAVIDGVTSQTGYKFQGMYGGCFAKNIILNCLKTMDVSKYQASEFFEIINDSIGNKTKELYPDLEFANYPKAVMILFNKTKGEIWNYGDCQCMVDGVVLTKSKKIDVLHSELRAAVLEEEIRKGKSVEELLQNDVGHAVIKNSLKYQYLLANTKNEYGYPVLNGYTFEPDYVKIYPVHQQQEIVLASDGYPKILNTLEESEKYLHHIIETDPLCFREYKSTKGIGQGRNSFDDRTYWRGVFMKLY